jgi:hypothetical protein
VSFDNVSIVADTIVPGPAVVPEPVTMLSIFLAIGGLSAYMKKRARND